jgi:hypothetical protein
MTDRYGSANAAATDYRDKEVMRALVTVGALVALADGHEDVERDETVHRGLTLALAAKHRLTAIYPYRYPSPVAASCRTEPILSTNICAPRNVLSPRTGTPLNQNIAANANPHQLHTGTKKKFASNLGVGLALTVCPSLRTPFRV